MIRRFAQISQANGLIPTLMVSLVLFFAWLAQACGHRSGRVGCVAGLAMVSRGEVGLVFAEPGRTSGILKNEVYAALIIVIVLTTLLAPLSLKGFYRRFPREPI